MADYNILRGSICLSDIPKELIKRVTCRDGKERCYLNIAIIPRKSPATFNNSDGSTRTYTHFVSCAPKKEDQKDGVKYILGDIETRAFGQQPQQAAPQGAAPQAATPQGNPDLPF